METLPIKSNYNLQSTYKSGLLNYNSTNNYKVIKDKIINSSLKNEVFDNTNEKLSYQVDFYGFLKKGVYFDFYI